MKFESKTQKGDSKDVSRIPLQISAAQLPEEIMPRLREAVERNAFTDIEEQLDTMRALSPAARELADYMQKSLDRYDREGLLNALDLISHDS